jgi:hypothetical protein
MSAKWAISSYRTTAYSVNSASVSLTAQHIAPLEEQCNNSKICDFSGEAFKGSAIIFYECSDDTTALQRRV